MNFLFNYPIEYRFCPECGSDKILTGEVIDGKGKLMCDNCGSMCHVTYDREEVTRNKCEYVLNVSRDRLSAT